MGKRAAEQQNSRTAHPTTGSGNLRYATEGSARAAATIPHRRIQRRTSSVHRRYLLRLRRRRWEWENTTIPLPFFNINGCLVGQARAAPTSGQTPRPNRKPTTRKQRDSKDSKQNRVSRLPNRPEETPTHAHSYLKTESIPIRKTKSNPHHGPRQGFLPTNPSANQRFAQ